MKNCPWFSLRSNSIESRYARSRLNFLHVIYTYLGFTA